MPAERYLLDTHTFLWLKVDPARVSSHVLNLAANAGCEVILSAASCWEIAIKYQLGKLSIPSALATDFEQAASDSGFSRMQITFAHTQRVVSLPTLSHKDPFDRLLVAQSLVEGIPILSADKKLDQYGVTRVW